MARQHFINSKHYTENKLLQIRTSPMDLPGENLDPSFDELAVSLQELFPRIDELDKAYATSFVQGLRAQAWLHDQKLMIAAFIHMIRDTEDIPIIRKLNLIDLHKYLLDVEVTIETKPLDMPDQVSYNG